MRIIFRYPAHPFKLNVKKREFMLYSLVVMCNIEKNVVGVYILLTMTCIFSYSKPVCYQYGNCKIRMRRTEYVYASV